MQARQLIGRLSVALTTGILIGGCSTPYPRPEFHPDPPAITGIRQALDEEGRAQVISVHGMCTRTEDTWVRQTHAALAAQLGVSDVPDPVSVPTGNDVELYGATLDTPHGEVRHDALVWSPLTTPYKRRLCYDSRAGGGPGHGACSDFTPEQPGIPQTRAAWNDTGNAQMLNDCLADAVIYGGARGAQIRRQVGEAILQALAGAAQGVPVALTTIEAARLAAVRTESLYFISASLGSRILFDALRDLRAEEEGEATIQDQAVQQTRLRTRQIFMAANQLPILALARPDEGYNGKAGAGDATPDSLLAFARLPEEQRPPLPVAAFSDPSDVLSYTLRSSQYEDQDDITIQDVLVSNASIWLFGLFENPLPAHDGYLSNEAVLQAIVCGAPSRPDCQTGNSF